MRAPSTAADLSSRIEQLVAQRLQHMEAAEKLTSTIDQIEQLLGSAGAGAKRRGRPPGRPKANGMGAFDTAVAAPAARGRKRRRRRFEVSGEESIINFIKANRNPTTQDVKRHWATEGRGGTADNALSKLVRERKIKRYPLEDQRGSRFAV